MDTVFQSRVKERLRELNINEYDAAQRMGKSRTFVYDIVTGKKTSVQGENLVHLARALNVSANWLLGASDEKTARIDKPQERRSVPNSDPLEIASMTPRDVPVFGTASGSILGTKSGAWQLTDEPVDWVHRPPGLIGARDAYALYVENESMVPQHNPGDLVYVHPGRPVRSGDSVIVKIQNAERETYIKRFRKRENGDVRCEQHNPKSTVTYKRDTVIGVHKVLSLAELMGV
ncbi:MAG: S24 family peptidase [Pseudomonadota bacterium]